jgi:hypothetical protein
MGSTYITLEQALSINLNPMVLERLLLILLEPVLNSTKSAWEHVSFLLCGGYEECLSWILYIY